MRIAIVVLALTAIGISAQEPDETRYYNVTGTSAAELRASLNASRPATSDGVRHDGVTTWPSRPKRWTRFVGQAADSCRNRPARKWGA